MSKALVIPNVNFSVNKLDTVTIINDVPCTGIALNKNSATITAVGGTETLTATPTPQNTTDAITWASSNPHVATVNNGVVTAIANGTATITVTCGSKTATCAITVNIAAAVYKNASLTVSYDGSNNLRDYTQGQSKSANRFITWGAASGLYPCDGRVDDPDGLKSIYPYPIPQGAKTITVTRQNLAPLIVYYNKDVQSTLNSQAFQQPFAKVVYGETSEANKPTSIGTWTYDSRTFAIPDNIEGLDSFTLSFYTKTAEDYTNFDPDNTGIVITFGFE